MFRLLFVMLMTVVIGVGSGYFLWGTRVALLTQSLNNLTLEMEALRTQAAAPRSQGDGETPNRVADELHVINEAVTSFRQEQASQKALIEQLAVAAVPADVASVTNELRSVRTELAACIADKADLQMRNSGAATAPPAAEPAYQQPTYQQPTYQQPSYQQPAPQPSYTPPAQRYRPPGSPPAGSPGLDDPRY